MLMVFYVSERAAIYAGVPRIIVMINTIGDVQKSLSCRQPKTLV